MKMPATTMVAAWISADTGVGPAMASGSQVCRMNWPDLLMTAVIRHSDADQQQGVPDLALVGHVLRVMCRSVLAGGEVQDDHADQEADVAHAVGEEGLEGGVGVRLLLPPVADERERAEADQLPAHDHLQRVVGQDEEEHRGGEQAEEGEVVGVAAVAGHVVGGEDVHQQRDEGDDHQHQRAEAVDQRADLDRRRRRSGTR